MCIIAYKPQGKDLDFNTLATCFENNPDGAGFMYPVGNKIQITKGFMTFDAMEDYLLDNERFLTNKPVVFHFRWATHGKIAPSHCHPFPIQGNLRATHFETTVGIAHNGIIPGKVRGNESDTMAFIRRIKGNLNILRDTPGQKFVTMTPTKVTLIGSFVQDNDWYYSNNTYQSYDFEWIEDTCLFCYSTENLIICEDTTVCSDCAYLVR